MIRALIFDFDGLILETEEPEYISWVELYAEYGCTLPLAQWAQLIGTADVTFDVYGELERRLGRPVDRAAIRPRRRARHLALVEEKAVLPGVTDYIAEAQRLGLALGVASSGTREWVVGHLTRLGLIGAFGAVCCAGDVPRTKPDPGLYLLALERLAVPPRQAIALEDSANGIAAAKRAGLYCVAVPNAMTRHLMLDAADLRVASLADLPLEDLLARANAAVILRGDA